MKKVSSSVKDKKLQSTEQQIEKMLNECGEIRSKLEMASMGTDLRSGLNFKLAKRSQAYTTQPLTDEELDSIKYMNFATERDYRRGSRPTIPRKESVRFKRQEMNLPVSMTSTEESDNSAIIQDFSDFLETSFNGLSISDETDTSYLSLLPMQRNAASVGVETVWSQELYLEK